MTIKQFKEICSTFGLNATMANTNGEKWTCYQNNHRKEVWGRGIIDGRTNILCYFENWKGVVLLGRTMIDGISYWSGSVSTDKKFFQDKDAFRNELARLMHEIRTGTKQHRIDLIRGL